MPERNFELLKNSDPAALEKIHAQYRRLIFWVGRQYLDDDFVVENLVQDTFLKLWDYREKIENPLHILFFLKVVMKRSCYSHHAKPRNKFFKTNVSSFESYENYENSVTGYDPADELQNLKDQESQQMLFDLMENTLPLINPDRRHLLNLCLKYGFRYKAIARAMGKGTMETVNEVQRAIDDIKKIVNIGSRAESTKNKIRPEDVDKELSDVQLKILRMRCEMNLSFEAIAKELNLPTKEIHKDFMTAYRFTQR